MKKILKTFVLFNLILGFSAQAFGQNTSLSPYTRYGLGDINQPAFARSIGLGGLTLPVAEPFEVNMANPASYAFLKKPSFEVGLESKTTNFESSSSSTSGRITNVKYFAMGFPISRKMGLSFGLIPKTNVGYKMTDIQNFSSIGQDVEFLYEGDGGINQLFVGTAYKLYQSKHTVNTDKGPKVSKNDSTVVSVGINGSYLFGALNHERRSQFNSTRYWNTRTISNTLVSDFHMDGSLMMSSYIIKDKVRPVNKLQIVDGVEKMVSVNQRRGYSAKLKTAFAYGLNSELSATQDYIGQNYVSNSLGTEFATDTLFFDEAIDGTITLPQTIGIGASIDFLTDKPGTKKRHRYLFGIQYEMQNWADYSSVFGSRTNTDSLTNSNQLSVGLQYSPKWKSDGSANIFELAEYKIGFRSANTYLHLNNEQLKDYGISFGVALPVIKSGSFSKIHFGAEIGQRGTTDNNLIQENYTRFVFGITLSPNLRNPWFVKNKYN